MRLLTSSHLPCFLLFLALLQPSLAAKSAATSFCKCICFNNSTIIALNPPPPSRRGAQLHSLDIRSPGAHAGAESESIPDWSSSKRDTDDADDAAAVASSLSSSSPSASAAAASSTTTTGAVIFDDGDDANDHPPPARPHRNRKLSCSDCTRAFCLDYNLPICKEAEEEDVFTTCFQRDSLKDETVVVVFIFATAGLLGWALVKPWIDRLRERNTFAPIPQRDIPGVNIGR
ncbi:hypothetical protein RBB50_006829 [Rhinocladiella similis]